MIGICILSERSLSVYGHHRWSTEEFAGRAKQCSEMAGIDSFCRSRRVALGVDEAMLMQISYRASGDTLVVTTSSQDTYGDRNDCEWRRAINETPCSLSSESLNNGEVPSAGTTDAMANPIDFGPTVE